MLPRRQGTPAARDPHWVPLPPPGTRPGCPFAAGTQTAIAQPRLLPATGVWGGQRARGWAWQAGSGKGAHRAGAGAGAHRAGAAGAEWLGWRRGSTQHTTSWGGFKSGGLVRRKGAKGLGRGALIVGCSRRSPPMHPTPAAAMSCGGMCVRPRGMRPKKNIIEASQINDRPPKKLSRLVAS